MMCQACAFQHMFAASVVSDIWRPDFEDFMRPEVRNPSRKDTRDLSDMSLAISRSDARSSGGPVFKHSGRLV